MDQVKIGKFIAECRKNQGLTQMQLAEKFGITDRAVSKWETGKSMPDVSIMQDLCDVLHINVNELLSGEHLTMEEYQKQAEDNLMDLKKKEKTKNTIINILMYILVTVLVVRSVISIFYSCVTIIALKGAGSVWIIINLVIAVVMLILAYNIVKMVRKKNS